MLRYIARRIIYIVISMLLMTVFAFLIIQLPPGDYLSFYVTQLQSRGEIVEQAILEALKREYGLDQPMYMQYLKWFWKMLHGDLGRAWGFNMPVSRVIAGRLSMTVLLSVFSLLFTYALAIPIGIYSATHQYSFADYIFTTIGFIGLATPNFLLALILVIFFFKCFGVSVSGLFSPQYAMAPWSIGRVLDLLNHMWIPVIVIGTAGTCGLIRVMRGCLLDELNKQYVITARAKGLSERRVLIKYPVRVSINPIISTIGWTLPNIVSGATITSIVLSLPTVGAALLSSLVTQDMYLAGSLVMILSFLTMIGTLVSDILLVAVDPRIRYEKSANR